ncbi:Cupin domain-containing protein [Streptomyces sp. yr375]|uniref:cupin domain-containing protein n=1 Tax=Streptomyces sp. yr375 TaxID=1761906 RepID=UPI0008B8E5F5|nr:cupin domain-containing protein [Streptomyces sp. yr375]SEP63208.1 Cupin domain-containing protein [Streptomyces sp. yr375]
MVRRVVTGVSQSGKPVIVSDGEPPVTLQYTHTPGFARSLVWNTASPAVASADPTEALESYVPAPGETIALTITFPPASVFADPSWDPVAAGAEQLAGAPGLAELFEPDNPGMHTTPTVDYGVVLSGEIVLDLDGGETALLVPGDLIVQNGTRHAWRNNGTEPATVFFVLIGAGGTA